MQALCLCCMHVALHQAVVINTSCCTIMRGSSLLFRAVLLHVLDSIMSRCVWIQAEKVCNANSMRHAVCQQWSAK